MADRTCPACSSSLENNVSPSGRCLGCGHDLAMTAPPPGWKVGKTDLREIAKRLRQLLWIVLASIVFNLSTMILAGALPWAGLASFVLLMLLNICAIVCVLRLQAAQGVHIVWRVGTAILLFAPCINLLILLVVSGRATTTLQRTGLKVGLMGVSDDVLMRHLAGNLCKNCGYLLIGIASECCPECGEALAAVQRSDEAV